MLLVWSLHAWRQYWYPHWRRVRQESWKLVCLNTSERAWRSSRNPVNKNQNRDLNSENREPMEILHGAASTIEARWHRWIHDLIQEAQSIFETHFPLPLGRSQTGNTALFGFQTLSSQWAVTVTAFEEPSSAESVVIEILNASFIDAEIWGKSNRRWLKLTPTQPKKYPVCKDLHCFLV